ncbi:hypothetical protein [Streptomyces sp. NPDC002853]
MRPLPIKDNSGEVHGQPPRAAGQAAAPEVVDAADPDTNDPLDAAEALLVDRFDEHGPTATLFTGSQNGAYKHAERVPFAATVDTADFPG